MEEAKAMFASPDPELRRQAVMEFALAGSAGPLLQAINDSDWRVRKTAVDALVDIGGEEVFEGLFKALFSEDNAGARNSAAEAFVKTGPQAAASLCKRLNEPDADVRKFIVDIIGEIADKSSIPALIGMLDDPDENVRASAVEHLGKMKAVEALDRLVLIMRTEDQWLAFTAAAALGELGDKRAVPPLIEAAADKYLREAALDALCRISDESAWGVFIEYLSDPAQVIRQVAVKGLSKVLTSAAEKGPYIGSLKSGLAGDALSFLSSCLQEEDPELQNSALLLIGEAGEKTLVEDAARLLLYEETRGAAYSALLGIARQGVEPMLFLLTNPEALIRSSAASILGEVGDQRVVNFLIPILSDENGHARGAAATALGKLGDPKSVQPLFELLRDEYEDVQEQAIAALGSLRGAGLAEGLKDLAFDEDPDIRRNVASLIGLLDGPDAPAILNGLLKDEDPEVRRTAVSSLGKSGLRNLKVILKAITDEDSYVRLAAVNALSDIGTEGVVEALVLLLGDVDPWVRSAAARGLAGTGSKRAVAALMPLLKDSYGPVRIAVVEALGETRNEEAIGPIKESLRDQDPEIRKAAVGALVNFPGAGLDRDLLPLLEDENWSVRKAAVDTIGVLGAPGSRELLEKIAGSDEDDIVRESATRFLNG